MNERHREFVLGVMRPMFDALKLEFAEMRDAGASEKDIAAFLAMVEHAHAGVPADELGEIMAEIRESARAPLPSSATVQ